MIKKLTICIIALLLGIGSGSLIVFADDSARTSGDTDSSTEEVTENVTDKAGCYKGFRKFLTSMIDLDNFGPYWVDVFTKNMCYLEDVFALEEEMDSIQEEIRDMYYSCEIEEVDKVVFEYKKKKTELYFVRNSLPADSRTLKKDEIVDMQLGWLVHVYGTLYPDMVEKFVDDKAWFNEEDFDVYFEGLVDQYLDNAATYIDCNYGGWEEIATKWKELKEVFTSLKKDDKKTDTEEEEETSNTKDAPGNVVGNFFRKHFDLEMTSVDDIVGNLDELWDQVGQSGGGSEEVEPLGTDMASIYDAYLADIDRYETAETEAELMAEYKLLYGEGGADISNSFVELLQGLESTLDDTSTSYLPEIKKATNKISKKQCSD